MAIGKPACLTHLHLAFWPSHEFISSAHPTQPNPGHTCTKSYWTLAAAVLATLPDLGLVTAAAELSGVTWDGHAHAWERRPSKRRLGNSIHQWTGPAGRRRNSIHQRNELT
jgi:hypothetical protein